MAINSNVYSHLFTFTFLTTWALSQNIGKFFSELKSVQDILPFIWAEANWEASERDHNYNAVSRRNAELYSWAMAIDYFQKPKEWEKNEEVVEEDNEKEDEEEKEEVEEKEEEKKKEEDEIKSVMQCSIAMHQNCTHLPSQLLFFSMNEEEKEEKEVQEEKEKEEEEHITTTMQSFQQCSWVVHMGQGNCQVNEDKEEEEKQVMEEDNKENGKEITTTI